MTSAVATCLVILAGGQSSRMGSDKALLEFDGERLVERLIRRFATKADRIILSGAEDYGTGLEVISDDLNAPNGPVGAIFTLAARLQDRRTGIERFVTVPVDAPFAPADLIERLSASDGCAVASDPERIHPTFAHWRCAMVSGVRTTLQPGDRAPSLQWLAAQCRAEAVRWRNADQFMNINRPADLTKAMAMKKAGA